MEVKRILDEDFLDELLRTSTWVWEGLMMNDENLKWIEENLEVNDRNTIYTCTGAMINKHYGFTGDNAYPTDYPFVFIYDYYDVIKRIEFGAQWFDVLIENNLLKQELQDNEDEYEEE